MGKDLYLQRHLSKVLFFFFKSSLSYECDCLIRWLFLCADVYFKFPTVATNTLIQLTELQNVL